jgi:hypothetical protein
MHSPNTSGQITHCSSRVLAVLGNPPMFPKPISGTSSLPHHAKTGILPPLGPLFGSFRGAKTDCGCAQSFPQPYLSQKGIHLRQHPLYSFLFPLQFPRIGPMNIPTIPFTRRGSSPRTVKPAYCISLNSGSLARLAGSF